MERPSYVQPEWMSNEHFRIALKLDTLPAFAGMMKSIMHCEQWDVVPRWQTFVETMNHEVLPSEWHPVTTPEAGKLGEFHFALMHR
eukprot:115169-Pyramimonas_sp.AAC.1